MALDPGRKRIGVAVSDELGFLASPVAVIERTTRLRDLERLRALVREHNPGEIVVGIPLLPSGDRGRQAQLSVDFAGYVEEQLERPVRLWNESYSTVEALRRREQLGRKRRRSAAVDAEAAAIILQDYLDAHR